MAALNQSCCGCSLKTGTKIIAVIYLLASLFQIGMAAICMRENYSNAVDGYNRLLPDENLQVYLNISNDDFSHHTTVGILLRKLKVSNTHLTVCLVFGIIQAQGAILLFFGASKSKPVLLLPWMTVQSIVTITVTVVSFIICARIFRASQTSHYPVIGTVYISVMLNVYILLVVSSFYQTLCERTGETPNRTAQA